MDLASTALTASGVLKIILYRFCPFLFLFFYFLKSGIDNSTEWSMIPACPSFMCFFFNRGDTEGTNSLNILCSMFVYVLFYVNLCQD